ncbi:MAG: hypothetical protein M0Z94_04850 [Dehalococcoidales bacterium]|nr:hypothetical protein [Dehalococcoidales bacterium]
MYTNATSWGATYETEQPLVEVAIASGTYAVLPTAECKIATAAPRDPYQLAIWSQQLKGYIGFRGLAQQLALAEALAAHERLADDLCPKHLLRKRCTCQTAEGDTSTCPIHGDHGTNRRL